jgi:hypothetical protein
MGTILTMAITIDNYWLDLIIIKESYSGWVDGGLVVVNTAPVTELNSWCL